MPPPTTETLFLRSPITLWVPREDLAFRYVCDAYFLNLSAQGEQPFRIGTAKTTDINWASAAGSDGHLRENEPAPLSAPARDQSPLRFAFHGEHTVRVDFVAGSPRVTIGPRTFHDPSDIPVTDPVATSLLFDSRDLASKKPFGAIAAGRDVEFRLDASPGVSSATLVIERRRLEGPQDILDYSDAARVPLMRAANGGAESWRGTYRFDDIGVYGFYFVVDIGGKKYLYEDNADPIYWTREIGSNGIGAVVAATDTTRIRRFRQTVYRGDYAVPAWARDVVYYYIFPERFRNGNPKNDPVAGPHTFRDQSVEVHHNWLEKPWMPHSGDGSDDLYGNDFFGGDLAGVIEKLDYIRALGANTIYMTPIFRAASNHKYDTGDYHTIDPHFGSNADFERLTREAKRRGIRIVLDTSLNHTGTDSIYFNRYGNYPELGAFNEGHIQPQSPYFSWYSFDAAQTDPDRQYHGWTGVQDLPELDKTSPAFRSFAYGAPDSVMKRWLDRGASGWRMDVVPWIADDFWREWRAAIKGHRADALTVAETQFESSKFFLGDEFDSTMNYIFRDSVQSFAAGDDARTTYRAIELMRELYPPQTFYALMNLLSSHDSPRALYVFGYRDDSADAATIALAKRRLHLAAFFQMVFPGSPAILYGDEVGVTGGEDPFDRGTYPWADLGGKPDAALLQDYKRLTTMRRNHPVLRHGSIDAPIYLDAHVIVLLRHDGAQWAITAMNNSNSEQRVQLTLPDELRNAKFVDALTDHRSGASGLSLNVSVPALDGVVLIRK